MPIAARTALLMLLLLGTLTACLGSPSPPAPDALSTLGWRLMADRRLSVAQNFACLDCHRPDLGFADGLPVATADGLNTPTLWGLAERSTFGWFTPEVGTLEAFVLRPLNNPREMGPLAETTLERLRTDSELARAYADTFPNQGQLITWEQTAQALAAAIRTIPVPDSAYRRNALAPAAARGQALFAEIGCGGCHRGPTLSSESYLNTGVSADVSRNRGLARVPSLLGLAQTAPYFHDGSAATLEEVVGTYERGGQVPGPIVTPAISPFLLTADERRDLLAFLTSL